MGNSSRNNGHDTHLLVGMFIVSSAAKRNKERYRTGSSIWRARSEAALARKRGEAKLLLTRGVQVSYDKVQVLFSGY